MDKDGSAERYWIKKRDLLFKQLIEDSSNQFKNENRQKRIRKKRNKKRGVK